MYWPISLSKWRRLPAPSAWTRTGKRFSRAIDFQQQEFLRFVHDHYVARGVRELDTDKLPQLIESKYHSIRDAVRELGPAVGIREVFVGFQRHLY